MVEKSIVSLDTFFDFIRQHPERDFELIEGEVVEVVADGYASQVALEIGFHLRLFLRQSGIEGRLTGADGGYMIAGNPYIPDVAFISAERQPEPDYINGYNVLAPDLAVEVRSPGNTERGLTTKVVNYLNAGTLVWLVDPETQSMTVYAPGAAPVPLTADDTLTGGDVLPGFSIPVRDIFPPRQS